MNALALPRTVADLIEEYEGKATRIEAAIAAHYEACDALTMAATVQGTFVETVLSRPFLHERTLRANLLKSGWRAVMDRLQIDKVATAADKQRFDRDLANPPPLTLDTAVATFRDYLERPRFHILRGLAEVFSSLDPAYRSHEKARIGAKGLPKRIILSGFGSFHSSYAEDRLRDVINALAALQGLPAWDWPERAAVKDILRTGEDAVLHDIQIPPAKAGNEPTLSPRRGLTLRQFGNGNLHVIFEKWALVDINRALAEFYGDVLPDVTEDDPAPSASTALAKDLQFYWTPPDVAEAALGFADMPSHTDRSPRYEPPVWKVLEPSCGEGHLMDAIRARGHVPIGYECHSGRADIARSRGHAVITENFLIIEPSPQFDCVIMNPPFYGRHYAKHVRHALAFLKPGGTLVAILPATACYDHGELAGEWRDLPVASFAQAGTNVPTVLLKIKAPRA